MWDFCKCVCINVNICNNKLICTSQKIYVELDDSDGVAGSAAINTIDPNLAERILQYEISGMTSVHY